ncbi:hypothetical protein GCM10023178_22550 [Actinomadura luteofluorescens]
MGEWGARPDICSGSMLEAYAAYRATEAGYATPEAGVLRLGRAMERATPVDGLRQGCCRKKGSGAGLFTAGSRKQWKM